MGLFIKQETRSAFTDDEQEVLISTMPNFSGMSNKFTSATSLENSDIWSAINIIASDMASLNLEYFLQDVKQDTDDFSYLMNVRPNDFYNGFTLKFVVIANILLNGESFIELIKDKDNNVVELYHIKNSEITYKQDKSTNYKLIYFIENNGKKRTVKSGDILHFKFFSTDAIRGISPLLSLKDEMETQRNSKKFLNNFFKQGFSGSGILTFKGGKLSAEARDNIKDEWQKSNAGASESHKIVVLDESMSYEKLEVNTEVLHLINSSNFSTEQVAKIFKIPRHKLGLESSNMSLEQANNSYIVNTLNPYLMSLTSEVDFKLTCHKLRVASYKFDVDAFKFIDIETKTKAITNQLQAGIIDLNEARKQFGYAEKDDVMFNEHFISLNYSTLSNLSTYQMAKAKSLPIQVADKAIIEGGENDE